MNVYARIFLRGLLMVTLVACNTRQIASGHLSGAVAVGFLISAVWWENSSQDRPHARFGAVAYGSGAALGTALGYLIANWLGKVG